MELEEEKKQKELRASTAPLDEVDLRTHRFNFSTTYYSNKQQARKKNTMYCTTRERRSVTTTVAFLQSLYYGLGNMGAFLHIMLCSLLKQQESACPFFFITESE